MSYRKPPRSPKGFPERERQNAAYSREQRNFHQVIIISWQVWRKKTVALALTSFIYLRNHQKKRNNQILMYAVVHYCTVYRIKKQKQVEVLQQERLKISERHTMKYYTLIINYWAQEMLKYRENMYDFSSKKGRSWEAMYRRVPMFKNCITRKETCHLSIKVWKVLILILLLFCIFQIFYIEHVLPF